MGCVYPFQADKSLEAATSAAGMKQPGLVKIGAQSTNYLCFLDGVLVPVEIANILEGIEYLLMVFCVFNLAYPEELRPFYGFIEAICNIPVTVKAPTIHELLTQLQ